MRWLRAVLLPVVAVASLAAPGCGGGGTVESLAPDTLAVWLAEGRPLVVLDTRPRDEYERRRVPGAVPAGGRTVSQLREVLPLESGVPVVVVDDDGVVADGEYDLARRAAGGYGFRSVYRLRGGFAAWANGSRPVDGEAVLDR